MLAFFHWSYTQHLVLSEMNVSNIYVSTNESLLQIIYILRCRGNNQHSMSTNTDFNNISIHNYKREVFLKFVLVLHVYVTHLFN